MAAGKTAFFGVIVPAEVIITREPHSNQWGSNKKAFIECRFVWLPPEKDMTFNFYDASIGATLECEIESFEDYQELRSIKLNGVDLGAWFPEGCDKEIEILNAYDQHCAEQRAEAEIEAWQFRKAA